MELKAKVTSKGKLTIPKEGRKALGVREGDSLLFGVDDDEQVRVHVERKPVSFADLDAFPLLGNPEAPVALDPRLLEEFAHECFVLHFSRHGTSSSFTNCQLALSPTGRHSA